MHQLLYAGWQGVVDNLDRIFSVIAIIIATYAIWDVRKLFKEVEARDKNTETRLRQELLTHFASYATFAYASQFIDFVEGQPGKEASVAILQTFHTQKLLAPNATKAELTDLQKKTRSQIAKEAVEWARLMVTCGLGTMKEGWGLPSEGE
jgi:hypothetical protein